MRSLESSATKTVVRASRRLFRFSLPDFLPGEACVAPNLTVRRTPDNLFVIPHEAVASHHGVVKNEQGDPRGEFAVCCLHAQRNLELEEHRVREVVLRPGMQFRPRPGRFECPAIPQVGPNEPQPHWSVCTVCYSAKSGRISSRGSCCPTCGLEGAVLQDALSRGIVLPIELAASRFLHATGQGGMTWLFEASLPDWAEPVPGDVFMAHLLAKPTCLHRFRHKAYMAQPINHGGFIECVAYSHGSQKSPNLPQPWTKTGKVLPRRQRVVTRGPGRWMRCLAVIICVFALAILGPSNAPKLCASDPMDSEPGPAAEGTSAAEEQLFPEDIDPEEMARRKTVLGWAGSQESDGVWLHLGSAAAHIGFVFSLA